MLEHCLFFFLLVSHEVIVLLKVAILVALLFFAPRVKRIDRMSKLCSGSLLLSKIVGAKWSVEFHLSML